MSKAPTKPTVRSPLTMANLEKKIAHLDFAVAELKIARRVYASELRRIKAATARAT